MAIPFELRDPSEEDGSDRCGAGHFSQPPAGRFIEMIDGSELATAQQIRFDITPISAERLELTLLLSLVFVHRKANWMRYPLSHGIR